MSTTNTARKVYAEIDALWSEADTAPIDPEVAVSAARKLYRFVRGRTWPAGAVRVTSGNRYTQIRGGVLIVNVSARRHGGPWQALVHELSHSLFARMGTMKPPHSSEHARLERRMVKEIIKRDFLRGDVREPDSVGY